MNTLIGRARDRIDGPAKVTGAARYSAEIQVPELAHGAFATSTIAAGRVTRIDDSEAKRAPGVIGVLTHQTMPPLPHQPVYNFAKQTGMTFSFLQDDRILFGGQPIAMIIAETREQAESAAELIAAEYEADTPVATLADAQAHDLENLFGFVPARSTRGDIEAGLSQAAVRVSASYSFPAHRHHPIELSSTTAVWDGPRLTVYETTQGVSMTQINLCDLLGLDPENVRVVSHYLGGGFGVKGMFWAHTAITALAAREAGRPVKLVITRDQMTTLLGHREEQRQELTLGATRDGKLTAIRHHKLSATSMTDDWTEPSCSPSTLLYACDNVETAYRVAPVHTVTPTFFRGVGHSSGLFGLESAMDELAYELGIDPLELRLRNHSDVDPRSGSPWASKSLKECYARGAEMIGWHDRDPAIRSIRQNGWLLGYGMGTALYDVAPLERTETRLRLYADARVRVQFGGQDLGTGTYTTAALTAADALGIPIGAVQVELGDTDLPRAGNSIGAANAAAVSSAVHLAAQALIRRLAAISTASPGSPLQGADPDKITARDGQLVACDGRSDALDAVLPRAALTTLDVMSEWNPASGLGTAAGAEHRMAVNWASSFSYGAWFALVAVHPDFGLVRLRRLAGAFAAGRILNEKTAASQMRGGAIMGIGQALLEGTSTDCATGRILNPGLNEYMIPAHADVPQIDVTFVEEVDEQINVLGVKGIGELPISGVAPAITSAVYHATGRRIRELPIRPEMLL
jgi:xanthine dehydrogenase YagR molybdenum-binding subunit